MMLRTLALAALSFVQAFAFAQHSPYVGTWTGTMKGNGGGNVGVQVKLEETTGIWRMTASGTGAGGNHNPCFGKDMPVAVERNGDTILLDVSGDKVMPGCMNQRATLMLSGDQMSGTLADGRAVSLKK